MNKHTKSSVLELYNKNRNKHAKPSVLELYAYIREKKKESKDCPIKFSGIKKAELLKIAFDMGYKMPAVKRTDVKKGKTVNKIGKKLNKQLQHTIQKKKKGNMINELKNKVINKKKLVKKSKID